MTRLGVKSLHGLRDKYHTGNEPKYQIIDKILPFGYTTGGNTVALTTRNRVFTEMLQFLNIFDKKSIFD